MADSDFGRTADDYRRFRAGFPDSLFERLTAYGVGLRGQLLVDLGTGTGSLARGFASRGLEATGIDPDPHMLAQARLIGSEEGVAVRYVRARAESTGLASYSVDVVTAGQCWHWFDRARAAREVARILKPRGKVLIVHFDWLPLRGNCVEATEQLILEHSPEWKGAGGWGMHPWWLRDLGEAGFRRIETFSYDEDVLYSHEGWRGRIRASAGIASLPEDRRDDFDRALERLLRESFSGEPLTAPHRVFAVVADAPRAVQSGSRT